MQLERHAVVPLRVSHIEQIDLGHRAGDVEEGIDAAEALERTVHDDVCRFGLAQIDSEHGCLSAGRSHLCSGRGEILLVSRGKNQC